VVPEAPLAETEAGLVPAGAGWFVLNAREARWIRRDRRGHRLPFTGSGDAEEAHFAQLGVNLIVLGPGEPIGMYHWEADQEDFLVVSGEAVLIVEGEERPLRAWDFVHCPPNTKHVVIGAGTGPCLVIAVGARERSAEPDSLGFPADEVAKRYGASVEEDTMEGGVAYASVPSREPIAYRDGWLPG
jgi:uncharacterized cupin superfamily protein